MTREENNYLRKRSPGEGEKWGWRPSRTLPVRGRDAGQALVMRFGKARALMADGFSLLSRV